jgi:hypothetical protein
MRVLLAGMPNMLASIITAALQQFPDIVIVGVADKHASFARRIRMTRAEAVIMPAPEPGDFEYFRPLLLMFPTLRIIGIKGDGERAFVHELHPRSTPLAELSAASLLAALQNNPQQSTH